MKKTLYLAILIVMTALPGAFAGDTDALIHLRYLAADKAMNVLQGSPGVSKVTVVNSGLIIVTGTDKGIDGAKSIIAGMDTSESQPKPVRVRLDLKATLVRSGKAPKTFQSSVSAVGPEREALPLKVLVEMPYYTTVQSKSSDKLHAEKQIHELTVYPIDASLTPVRIETSGKPDGGSRTGLISLVGTAGFEFVETDVTTIKKRFNVSVSVPPGKRTEVSSGSEPLPDGKLDYVMTVTAVIEEGTVVPMPGSNQYGAWAGSSFGGYGSAPAYPSPTSSAPWK